MKNYQNRRLKGFVKKGNVMTPLNWMCSVVETLLLTLVGFHYDNWVGISCLIFAIIIVIFYGMAYSYFAIKDPDRLQSEQFNLDTQEMRLNYQIQSGQNSIVKATEDGSRAKLVQASIIVENKD